jgi:acyl-coenzyme A thioesterase PaaI-like protein
LGKTIAHTRTEFRCSKTATLLAYASQVKYMPTGLFWLDTLLRYPTLHDWYIDTVCRVRTIPNYEQKSLVSLISEHLQTFPPRPTSEEGTTGAQPNDKEATKGTKEPPSPPFLCATFTVTTEHTNPFGALHGGCHAMVMEQVALDFARTQLSSTSSSTTTTTSDDNPAMMIVEAMQLEFLSPGIQGPIDVYCEIIGNDESTGSGSSSEQRRSLHVRVQLRTRKNNRLSSEGKLRISTLES